MDRRILHLSDKVISFNGAHYTAWHARRQYLVAANNQAALYRELEYVGTMTEMNQKNYQVWHHRRVIAEVLGDITGELPFVDKILMLDAKARLRKFLSLSLHICPLNLISNTLLHRHVHFTAIFRIITHGVTDNGLLLPYHSLISRREPRMSLSLWKRC